MHSAVLWCVRSFGPAFGVVHAVVHSVAFSVVDSDVHSLAFGCACGCEVGCGSCFVFGGASGPDTPPCKSTLERTHDRTFPEHTTGSEQVSLTIQSLSRTKMVPFTPVYQRLVEAIRRIFGLSSISFFIMATDGKVKRLEKLIPDGGRFGSGHNMVWFRRSCFQFAFHLAV